MISKHIETSSGRRAATLFAAACLLVTTAQAADDLTKPIKVSPDGHFLTQPDGQPFFWLGDTAWSIFTRLNREEADAYLRNRADKGFTVIQAVAVGGPLDGLEVPNRYGELPLIDKDPARPNLRYFEHIDWIVNRAASYGIRVALLPVWGLLQISSDKNIFTESNAEAYGRWFAHRYRNKGIIWVLGGDANPLWVGSRGKRDFVSIVDYRPIYDAMAKGLTEAADGDPFITYHPSGLSFPGTSVPRMSLYFYDRTWLDMNMLQSSHFIDASAHLKRWHADFSWDTTRGYEPVSEEYRSTPTRPVIDGEAMFEENPIDLDDEAAKGYWSGYDTRNAAYQAVFAGAAGHTYGHNSIWQFFGTKDRTYERKQISLSWQEAMDRPTSGQMQHLKKLMLSRPYFTRIPDQSLLIGQSGEGEEHIGATRDKAGSYAMIYLPKGKSFAVDLSKMGGLRAIAWWFDPRTGAATRIEGRFPTTGAATFTPPSNGAESDWVLVLDDESRNFPAPGQN